RLARGARYASPAIRHSTPSAVATSTSSERRPCTARRRTRSWPARSGAGVRSTRSSPDMGKQQRGVETMERVLEAALACFTFRGLYDATIEDVAKRSGVSVGSIYHHFGSRDRIALVLYCRSMESLLGDVCA